MKAMLWRDTLGLYHLSLEADYGRTRADAPLPPKGGSISWKFVGYVELDVAEDLPAIQPIDVDGVIFNRVKIPILKHSHILACDSCGAAVYNMKKHADWHNKEES